MGHSAVVSVVVLLAPCLYACAPAGGVADSEAAMSPDRASRQLLLDELRPVLIANCEMERFGAERDGGYLLCANLLRDVEAAYSYGIEGRDSWGCAVSRRYDVTVHQYDCFNTTEPSCPSGSFAFHPECVGDSQATIQGRAFDSLSNQIVKNGDQAKRIVVKMDVEGAEWDSLLSTPDQVLSNIDQLAIEFHTSDQARYLGVYLSVVTKLKRQFYITNLHFNNYSCTEGIEPFPGWAFEVLLVNKSVAELDESGARPDVPHVLDVPNSPDRADCQSRL